MSWTLVPARELVARSAAWDYCALQCNAVPFFRSAFLLSLLTEFSTAHELVALYGDPERPESVAIVQPGGAGRWQTFQPSQLPLGAWVSAVDTDLVERAGALLCSLPGLALSLGVTQLDPALCPRPPVHRLLRLQPYVDTSFVEVVGSFDDYWNSRGKNLRQNTRKLRRRLCADGVTVRLDCVRDSAGLTLALAQFAALEEAGWKAQTGTSVGVSDPQGCFYRSMLMEFCRTGNGRVYRYWIGDRVAAMDLCIDSGSLVVILKTAYDETLGHLSPAVLMREELFRSWWLEGRFQRIEFYGRTMEWHTRWTDSQRSLYHATIFRLSGLRELRQVFANWPNRHRSPSLGTRPAGVAHEA